MMPAARKASVWSVPLALLLVSACGMRTTVLGPTAGTSAVSTDAGISIEPSDDRAQTAICGASEGSDDGLLLDPPRDCWQTLGNCSGGHVFQLLCDGLVCDCLVDGEPLTSFHSPSCPDIMRVESLCRWGSVELVDSIQISSRVPSASEPCESTEDLQTQLPGCECSEGFISCPTTNGCFLEGRYQLPGTELTVVIRSDGTLIASTAAAASIASIESGSDDGFVGTWQLSGDTLFLRTTSPSSDSNCDGRVGSYRVTVSSDCSGLGLRVLDDGCGQRSIALTLDTLQRQAP